MMMFERKQLYDMRLVTRAPNTGRSGFGAVLYCFQLRTHITRTRIEKCPIHFPFDSIGVANNSENVGMLHKCTDEPMENERGREK